MRPVHLLLPLLLAFVAGCQETKPAAEEIDFGTLENSVYRNEYFGMSVTLPPDWSVQDAETRRELMQAGGEIIAGDNASIKAAVKASEMTTVNLLTAFQHPLGAPVDFNPSLICVAEKLQLAPGVKTSEDYFFHAKKLFETSQLPVSFPQEITAETLGGKEFGVMHVDMMVPGVTVHQKYYVLITKGYAFSFIASYNTDEERSALQDILATVTFE